MASAMQPDKKVKEAIFRICYVIAALMFCGEVALYAWFFAGVAFAGSTATVLFAIAFLKAMSFIVFVRGAVNLQFPEFALGGIFSHLAYKISPYEYWLIVTDSRQSPSIIASIFSSASPDSWAVWIGSVFGGIAIFLAIAYFAQRDKATG